MFPIPDCVYFKQKFVKDRKSRQQPRRDRNRQSRSRSLVPSFLVGHLFDVNGDVVRFSVVHGSWQTALVNLDIIWRGLLAVGWSRGPCPYYVLHISEWIWSCRRCLFVDKQSRGSCRSTTLQLDEFIFTFYCTLYKYSMYSARHVSRTYVTFYSLAVKRTNKSHARTLATSFAIALSLLHLRSSALSVRHRNWFWGMNIPPARFTDWFRRKMGSNFSALAETFVEFSIPIFFSAGKKTQKLTLINWWPLERTNRGVVNLTKGNDQNLVASKQSVRQFLFSSTNLLISNN